MFESPVYPQIQLRSVGRHGRLRSVLAEAELLALGEDPGFRIRRLVRSVKREDTERSRKRSRNHESSDASESPLSPDETVAFEGLFTRKRYPIKTPVEETDVEPTIEGETEPETETGAATDSTTDSGESNIEDSKAAKPWNSIRRIQRAAQGRDFDLSMHGLDPLPRPMLPRKIILDKPSTVRLYQHGNLSERTRKLLTKDNLCYGDGAVSDHSIRYSIRKVTTISDVYDEPTVDDKLWLRVTNNINSILHLAMLRDDYPLAARAFASIARARLFSVRVIWTIALELLVWRRELREQKSPKPRDAPPIPNNNDIHTRYEQRRTGEDDGFLEWMVVNFPYMKQLRDQRVAWKVQAQAPELYPYLLMSRLRHSDPKDAIAKLEDLILRPPFSEDPIYFALGGIACIQLLVAEVKSTNPRQPEITRSADAAKKYFEKCIKLGGVLPEELIEFEIGQLTGDGQKEEPGEPYLAEQGKYLSDTELDREIAEDDGAYDSAHSVSDGQPPADEDYFSFED